MVNKLRALKKSDKKGFTLVELIVVLVILAILAALLIPALTGYIDKAKEKSVTAECRQVVMAAQTLSDEMYGTMSAGSATITFKADPSAAEKTAGAIDLEEVAKLAEVTESNIKAITVDADSHKITKVNYENKGIKVTFNGTAYTKVNSFS